MGEEQRGEREVVVVEEVFDDADVGEVVGVEEGQLGEQEVDLEGVVVVEVESHVVDEVFLGL